MILDPNHQVSESVCVSLKVWMHHWEYVHRGM